MHACKPYFHFVEGKEQEKVGTMCHVALYAHFHSPMYLANLCDFAFVSERMFVLGQSRCLSGP